VHDELAHRKGDGVAVARGHDDDRGSSLPLARHRADVEAGLLENLEERESVEYDGVAHGCFDRDVHAAPPEERRRRDRAIGDPRNAKNRGLRGVKKSRRYREQERRGETWFRNGHEGKDATVPAGVKQAARLSLLLILCFACRAPEHETRSQAVARVPPVEDLDVATRSARAGGGRPPVIWIGLDGLDWEILDRLAGEGRMPNWKRLVSEGWSAHLETFFPLISPILWTSAATGVTPDVHRVLDFQEVDPKTGAKVPISGDSRAVPAVWNLASAAGRKVGVVGWWATHPAEEVHGFFVSDRASPILFEKLPLAGVAFPTTLEAGIAQVIGRDGHVTEEDLAPFLDVPRSEIAKALSERESSGGRTRHPVAGLARVLAATRVSHRIARDLYDRERPDLLALYLEGTDEVGHLFAPDTPPKLDCTPEADVARYGRVVDTYYAVVDRLLGQWMRRAREDGATLVVHSDHGFKWGRDRPCGFSAAGWATAAFWHRPEGVLAAWGAGAERGRGLIPGGGQTPPRGKASILDVAPTVLALLDLPADPKMPGRVLTDGLRGLSPPTRKDVFATTPVRRVAAVPVTAEKANEYAMKLIALGYLSPSETRPLAASGGDRPGPTEGAWNNLGVYLRDTRRDYPGAQAAFEKSLALRPDYYSALFNMAVLDRDRGNAKAAEEWFFRSVTALGGDPAPAVVGWAREYEKVGNEAAARSLLAKGLHSYPHNEEIARALAMALFRARECASGVTVLSRFEAATRNPDTLNALALLETCLENRPEVVRLLRRSLELKPDQRDVVQALRRAEGG
jgi:tetratricopeptide (TPR) repeat protein